MWSNGGTSGSDPGGGPGPGPWNQWSSFNPFTLDPAMAAAGQVDWGALAQQWIQMKDTQPPPHLQFQAMQAHQQLQLGHSAVHLAHAGNQLLMHQSQLPQGLIQATAAQMPREMAGFNGMLNPALGFQMEPILHVREEIRPNRVEAPQNRLEVKEEWTNSADSFHARDYGHSQSSGFRDSVPPPPSSSTSLWEAVQRHASMNDRRGGTSSDGNDDGSGGDHSRSSFDTAEMMKKKSLPAWIREGLEKVEREKRKKQEKEEEDARKARQLEEERLRKAEQEKSPTNTKWARESDEESEGEKSDNEKRSGDTSSELRYRIERFLRHLNHDDNIDEMMLCIRRQLTSVLLQGTSELMTKIVTETLNECKERARRKSKIDLDLVNEREIKRKVVPEPKPRIQLVNHGSSSDSESDMEERSKPESLESDQVDSRAADGRRKNTDEQIGTRNKPEQRMNDREERKSHTRSPSPSRSKTNKLSSSPKRHRDKKRRSRSNSRSRSRSRSRTRRAKRSRSRSRSRTPSKHKKSKSRHRDREQRSVSRSRRSRSDSRSNRRSSKERKKSKKKKSRSRSRSRDRSPGRSNRRADKKKKKRRSSSSSPERRRR